MAARGDISAGRAYVELYVRDNALSRGLASAGKRLRDFGQQATQAGLSLVRIGTVAAVPFALAARQFAGFDDAMRQVQAVTKANEADFAQLTETAKELGRTTSFTAEQVALLMVELGRAGFSAQQVDRMTASVLDLSRATGTEAVLSSGILAATLRQFGMDASQAGRAADALTAAANGSFNTVELLGEALSYAGPVAADFGMSLEETLAILGALGNVGIQGSAAGTVIRRLLTLNAAEAQKLQDIFGVSMLDAAGNARPLVAALEDINNATAGMGNADRAAKFNEAFGLLGITGASVLGRAAGSVRDLQTAIEGSEGAARKAAEQMDAGLGGSFRKLMSAVEGVAIAVGKALEGPLQRVVDWFASAAGYITEFVDANRGMVIVLAGAIASVVGIGVGLTALGLAASAAGIILSGLASVVAVLMSPLGLVTAAIVAQAAAMYAGVRAWLQYTDSGRQFAAMVTVIFGEAAGVVTQTIRGILDAIGQGQFAQAGSVAMIGLATTIQAGMVGISEYIGGVWGDTIADMGSRILAGDLQGAVATALQGIGSVFSRWAAGLTQAIVGVVNAIIDAIAGMVSWVSQQIPQLTQRIADTATVIADVMEQNGLQLQAQAFRGVASAGNVAAQVLKPAMSGAPGTADAVAGAVKATLDSFANIVGMSADMQQGAFTGRVAGATARERDFLDAMRAALADAAPQAGGGGAAGVAGGAGMTTSVPAVAAPDVSQAAIAASAVTFSGAALGLLGQSSGPQAELVREARQARRDRQKQIDMDQAMLEKLDAMMPGRFL